MKTTPTLVTALALAASLLPRPATAATGGPDSAGYTWADQADGCDTPWEGFSGAEATWSSPAAPVGPVPLGFTAPFHGTPVDTAWIGAHGFVTFDAASAEDPHSSRALPDPALPNAIIAAFWAEVPASEIRAESLDGTLHVRWVFDSLLDLPSGATCDLFFFRDGRFAIRWSHDGMTDLATVGHEGPGGVLGTTWFRAGTDIDPGFPDPADGRRACVAPPTELDCSAPLAATCGVLSGTLPPAGTAGADAYSCGAPAHEGSERVVELVLAGPRRVSLELDAPGLGLFHLDPERCSETACLRHGAGALSHPVLFAGAQRHVVDRIAPGGGDAFELTVSCEELDELTCDAPLTASRDSGNAFPSHGPGLALAGGEHALRVTAGAGALGVALDSPELWAIAYSTDGEMLRAGRGGVALSDLPPGELVVVVDGPEGAPRDVTATLSCTGDLGCPPEVEATCEQAISGDTREGVAETALYPCVSDVLDGAESVHRISNPTEQVVTAHLSGAHPLQRVLLLEECDESTCVDAGTTSASCARLPPGEHLLVVDSPAGFEGPYEIRLTCEPRDGTRVRVVGIDAADTWGGCEAGPTPGLVLVTLENPGAEPSAAPFDVVAFEDGDRSGSLTAADRELGRATILAALSPGETRAVDVPVVAPSFREALIHVAAEVPVGASVGSEGDVASTATSCSEPPAGFELVLEWARPGEAEWLPLVTASVADLDGDGIPELAFQADELPRAVSGLDGAEHWDPVDGRARVWLGQPAIADLTADGRPEVIYRTREFRAPELHARLLALDGEGRLLWRTEEAVSDFSVATQLGGPTVGDVEGDGRPEIAWAAEVFRADGRRAWTPEPSGLAFPAPSSLGTFLGTELADLDGDGRPELVTGSVARRLDPDGVARVLWTHDDLPHGFPAVVDLDADGAPEVVLVRDGEVRALEGSTGDLRWQRALEPGTECRDAGHGGTPTVADLDGDGLPEIGVVGRERYTVLEHDGALAWAAPMTDCTSAFTSAAVFDFQDDGLPEVVLRDEVALRILSGTDGTSLAEVPMGSSTTGEMPVVADVDADGVAEIVTTSEPVAGVHPGGILAWGPASGRWAGARRTWNERAYRPERVSEASLVRSAGTAGGDCVPDVARAVREQRHSPLPGTLSADVALHFLEALEVIELDGCRGLVRARLRVGNGGSRGTAGPVSVALYEGDPSDGVVLDVLSAPDLLPGAFTDLETVVELSRSETLVAVADDDGTGLGRLDECDEDDNACVASAPGDFPSFEVPEDVGPALRASSHGDPGADPVTASWSWAGDLGLPRPAEETYFIARGTDPRRLSRVSGTEGHAPTTWTDATPRAREEELPLVHYYEILAEDPCGGTSED